MISLIVAAADNDVIGRAGELPWRLSDDLRHFRRITMGKPVIMGRRTWESIGRPLPGRHNIVITRRDDYVASGCTVVASAEAAIEAAGDAHELLVIGGAEIYSLFLPRAGRIYMTRVHAEPDGDVRFGPVDWSAWTAAGAERHPADAANDFDYSFITYTRR